MELSYGYTDIFSQTSLCYASTPAPTGTGACAAAGCGTNKNLGTGYYDDPTHYGSKGFTWAPVKQFRSSLGERTNAINGKTEFLNPRQVAARCAPITRLPM